MRRCLTILTYLCTVLLARPVDMPSDTLSLEEVTVLAIKQNALFGEAVASTEIGEKLAERLDIKSVKGISDVVPNFFVPDYGSRITSSIYVRGIGARIDQPAVALNIDNVPVFSKDAYDFDLADITQLEMLRGPQSTLYGRNSMGGVINILTLGPMQWQGVRAMAEYGSGATWRLSGSIYNKVSKHVGLSLSVSGGASDGFFTNEYTGNKCDWEHSLSARFKTEWRPAANVSVLNTFAVSRLDQGGYPYEYMQTGVISYNDTCSYYRVCMSDGVTVSVRLPRFTLSSITSWQYIDDDMHLDQDFLPLDYFTLRQKRKEHVFTQDFVLRSRNSGGYNWLTGLFGFYRDMRMDAPVDFHDDGIAALIEQKRNEANPYFPIHWDERSFELLSNFKYPSYGVALYHESTLCIGRWDLTAGLRADLESPSLSYTSECHTSYSLYDNSDGICSFLRKVPVDIADQGHMRHTYVQLLPKLAAVFRLTSGSIVSNLYANIAKGYKAGGFNTQMFSDVLQQRLMNMMGVGIQYDVDQIVSYKPEKSWNFELGGHLESADRNLRADASVFYIDCTDQQLTMFPDGTTTGRIMTNAGKTRSYGFELSAHYSPVAPLDLHASYGYTNARFRKFDNGKVSYAGKYVPYAPEQTLFVAASYNLALPFSFCKTASIEVAGHGAGRIYWDEANSVSQPFYMLLDASVTFAHPRYSLQIWTRNVTGTKYHTFYFMSIGNQFVQRGRPFTAGVTVRIKLDNIIKI